MSANLTPSGGARSRGKMPAGPEKLRSAVLRGLELSPPESIEAVFGYIEETDPYAIPVLSRCIPHKFGYGHLLFLGTTDSGKTTCINQVLRDFLWYVGKGYGHRVFIWDYKRTARRYLESLPLEVPVYYLDPADTRSHGIAWARELDTDFAAKQFAKLVVHGQADQGGHNFVFTANARSLLYQVIRTFQKFAAGEWDLTDVVEACSTEENLARVLSKTTKGAAKLKTVLGAKGQRAGVFFSLEEFVSDFGPIAAALARIKPEDRITLREWLESESVLVLGHYEEYSEALAPFQRWVFGTLSRKLLSGPDIPHDGKKRTSFFLDEVRNSTFVGRDLTKLLNSARSKGGVAVAGLGDIAGLMDAIGEKKAEEFLGMFKTKVFLRLDGTAAGWVSEKYFGKHLRMVRKYSEGESVATALGVSQNWYQTGGGPSHGTSETTTTTPSKTWSYEAVERPVVYPGDLQKSPSPRIEKGKGLVVRAYLAVADHAWKECATHMDQATITGKDGVEDIKPRPNADFDTDAFGWGDGDFERLGLVQPSGPGPGAQEDGSPFEAMVAGAMPAGEEEDEDEEEEGPEVDLTWYDEGELEELRGEL